MTTGGAWTAVEQWSHINYLELSAAFLALKTFLKDERRVKAPLRMDNVTSIAFINRMGGTHSTARSDLAVTIWKWCLEKRITIHAEHLPGKLNVQADWESRHATDSSNWMLRRDVNFSPVGGDMGTLLHRLICLADECPAASLLQLAPGSIRSDHGCPVCPVEALKKYERRSRTFRSPGGSNPLFISVRKPHAPVKPCTIGRWLKGTMVASGINTSVFSAHSTRGAATSKAKAAGVSTQDILRAANWSSESTFCRYYHRPTSSTVFSRGVLGQQW